MFHEQFWTWTWVRFHRSWWQDLGHLHPLYSQSIGVGIVFAGTHCEAWLQQLIDRTCACAARHTMEHHGAFTERCVLLSLFFSIFLHLSPTFQVILSRFYQKCNSSSFADILLFVSASFGCLCGPCRKLHIYSGCTVAWMAPEPTGSGPEVIPDRMPERMSDRSKNHTWLVVTGTWILFLQISEESSHNMFQRGLKPPARYVFPDGM